MTVFPEYSIYHPVSLVNRAHGVGWRPRSWWLGALVALTFHQIPMVSLALLPECNNPSTSTTSMPWPPPHPNDWSFRCSYICSVSGLEISLPWWYLDDGRPQIHWYLPHLSLVSSLPGLITDLVCSRSSSTICSMHGWCWLWLVVSVVDIVYNHPHQCSALSSTRIDAILSTKKRVRFSLPLHVTDCMYMTALLSNQNRVELHR